MATYSHVFGSQFPDSLITLGNHKDIDDSVIDLVNQFETYMKNGNRKAASELYESNKETLKPYKCDMEYLNYLSEEIYNTGVKALMQYKVIQSENEPDYDVDIGNYWIQEYT